MADAATLDIHARSYLFGGQSVVVGVSDIYLIDEMRKGADTREEIAAGRVFSSFFEFFFIEFDLCSSGYLLKSAFSVVNADGFCHFVVPLYFPQCGCTMFAFTIVILWTAFSRNSTFALGGYTGFPGLFSAKTERSRQYPWRSV